MAIRIPDNERDRRRVERSFQAMPLPGMIPAGGVQAASASKLFELQETLRKVRIDNVLRDLFEKVVSQNPDSALGLLDSFLRNSVMEPPDYIKGPTTAALTLGSILRNVAGSHMQGAPQNRIPGP